MNCYILDDIYWKSIYLWLKDIFPNLTYPVKDNILDPLNYLQFIEEDDIVLLDNFFPSPNWWEEARWAMFLAKVIEENIHMKILCISDYGKAVVWRFDEWQEAYEKWLVLDFISTKDPNDIAVVLKPFII